MTPREVWSNESQERYVLAVAREKLDALRALCERERCPFAVVGEATEEQHLEVRETIGDLNGGDGRPVSVEESQRPSTPP
jgi:phosphoribosylformylglycinamidine synthase